MSAEVTESRSVFVRGDAQVFPSTRLKQFVHQRTLRQTVLGGKVRLCKDELTQQLVVVKETEKVCVDRLGRDAYAENPWLEIELLEHLGKDGTSDAVIQLNDWFHDERFLYAVFPYCAGGDLLSFIQEHKGDFTENFSRDMFYQLATHMQSVHDRGVCLLDFSPENVLLRDKFCVHPSALRSCKETSPSVVDASTPELVLIDLGLSQFIPSGGAFPVHTGPHRRGGKISYMAPEYFAGSAFDATLVDVYSLGVVLFVLLFGFPPFGTPCKSDKRFKLVSQFQLAKLLRHWKLVDRVEPEAVELLQNMLCGPERRWSLKRVLQHPWVRRATHYSVTAPQLASKQPVAKRVDVKAVTVDICTKMKACKLEAPAQRTTGD